MFEDPSIITEEYIFQILTSVIPKHAKILGFNMSTQVHHEDIRLETQKNTSYSHYGFIYKIICMKKFEWKCDQLFQELLNHGTIIFCKSSFFNFDHTYVFLKGNSVKHNKPVKLQLIKHLIISN